MAGQWTVSTVRLGIVHFPLGIYPLVDVTIGPGRLGIVHCPLRYIPHVMAGQWTVSNVNNYYTLYIVYCPQTIHGQLTVSNLNSYIHLIHRLLSMDDGRTMDDLKLK